MFSYTPRSFAAFTLLILFISLAPLPGTTCADYNPIEQISLSSALVQPNGSSDTPQITSSADGRYVVFSSVATNLVTNDTNAKSDIFIRDRQSGTTTRISVQNDGTQVNGDSRNPSISAAGDLVVFESDATNLVTDDANGFTDIFLFNRGTSTVTLISRRDPATPSNNNSGSPVISADGLFVAYHSDATNLILNDTNTAKDVFLYDVTGGTTTRVSERTTGIESDGASSNPAISADGSAVVFQSDATNLIVNDTNSFTDIFLFESAGPSLSRVSLRFNGNEANGDSTAPAVSDDGQIVAYQSDATDLVTNDSNGFTDIFVYDVGAATTQRVSVDTLGTDTNGNSFAPRLSETGQYVVFRSEASDVVTNDTNAMIDVFVADRVAADTARVSVRSTGLQSTGNSLSSALNNNANFVAFLTSATDLATADTNAFNDVYVINTQCLVAPVGVVPLDTDSDGTDDCTDECATDPGKVLVGVCGCGVADTDSDGDSTADCEDGCPSDPAKIAPGQCGCGEPETDSDGDGAADCGEPTTSTVPRTPSVLVKANKSVKVYIPGDFISAKYRVEILEGRKVVQKKTVSGYRATFKNLRGKYKARYKIFVDGGGFSQYSGKRKFKVE